MNDLAHSSTRHAVDYLCNAFFPDRSSVWSSMLSSSGSRIKLRPDSFLDADAFVAAMDQSGVDTVIMPALTPVPERLVDPLSFERVAASWTEMDELLERWPGRFAAAAVIDPSLGSAGIASLRDTLANPAVVAAYLHTHSWGFGFDAAELYPAYAVCAEAGVPVVMQAGVSGGPFSSACARPIGVERPSLYFPEVNFVLSHLAWPWSDEAIALATKAPNIWLGTGSFPPAHWSQSVRTFIQTIGRDKVIWGTNFPTVTAGKALAQIDDLDLSPEARTALVGGNARRLFSRFPSAEPGS